MGFQKKCYVCALLGRRRIVSNQIPIMIIIITIIILIIITNISFPGMYHIYICNICQRQSGICDANGANAQRISYV